MIIVVVPDPAKPPCVVYWLHQVRLHVEVVTWCNKSLEITGGVFQIPEDRGTCEVCAVAIKAWGALGKK